MIQETNFQDSIFKNTPIHLPKYSKESVTDNSLNINPTKNNFNKSHNTLYNSTIDNYSDVNTIKSDCYILDYQPLDLIKDSKQVFSSTEVRESSKWIFTKELVKHNSYDLLILPLMLGLLLFVAILIRYGKYLSKFFEGLVYAYLVDKIVSDINIPTRRLLLLLDAISIITFSYLGFELITGSKLNLDTGLNSLITLGVLCLSLLVYRLYLFIVHKVIGFILTSSKIINIVFYDSLIAIRSAGMILFPVVIIIFYINEPFSKYLLYLAIIAIGILLLYRYIRLISLFVKNSISLLYFILYLCALEIVPIVILYIEVQKI